MKRIGTFVVAALVLIGCTTGASSAEKLKVFILAGQSNMVGPAQHHTIAALYNTGLDRDQKLAKMVYGTNGEMVSKLIDEQVIPVDVGHEEIQVAVVVDVLAGNAVNIVELRSRYDVRAHVLPTIGVPKPERVALVSAAGLILPTVGIEHIEVAVVVEVAEADAAFVGVGSREVEARHLVKLVEVVDVGVPSIEIDIGDFVVRAT